MATVLDQYALSTLVNANAYLGLTADAGAVDTYIENLINRASAIIEDALQNKIMYRLNTKERHDGKNQTNMYFKQFPVLAVNLDELVWSAAGKTLTRKDGGSFILDGFVAGDKILVQNSDLNSGLLTIKSVSIARADIAFVDGGEGVEDTITTVAGDFVAAGFVIGDVITVIGSTSNDGTYTLTNVAVAVLTVATGSLTVEAADEEVITISSDGVAALILTFVAGNTIVLDVEDNNVIISRFQSLWIDDSEIDEDDYEVHSNHIHYDVGFPIGHGNVRMTYRGGYIAIPYDVERMCLRIVKLIYEKNEGIKAEKLGPYSVTYADVAGDMKQEIRNELTKYINVVI